MLSRLSVLAGFVLSAALVAQADVLPSEPGPGSVYNAGSTCTVSWTGDKDSPTAWKDLNIELMTGDNFQMVHITTIATGEDGTVDGRVNYPCPEVTLYSAVYFYQFTSPGAPDAKAWTTRFTIASPTGETVPPPNALQPNTNAPIPWGVGALVDPSKAIPPPGAGVTVKQTSAIETTSTTSAISTGNPTGTTRTTSRTTSPGATNTTSGNAVQQTQDSSALTGVSMGKTIFLGSLIAIASVLSL